MKRKLLTLSLLFAFTLPVAHGSELLRDDFTASDGLITNEYAYWNPSDPSAYRSPIWELTSGSLFAQNNQGWTGLPDTGEPNLTSSNNTNSAVFRLTTKRHDFGDVAVSCLLLNKGLSSTLDTPAVDWDGIHLWLRYQSQYHLYYASMNRRDNTVIIKKKTPGGPSNDGTYYELSRSVPFTVPYNSWQRLKATVKNNKDGSVTIQLFNGNTLLVSATDDGTLGGPPITQPGAVGIRGDNANLKFDDFLVESLGDDGTPSRPSSPGASGSSGKKKSSRILNQSTGDRQLILSCEGRSPSIFTRLGELVRGNLPQVSSTEYSWDGRSDSGQTLASGVYREECGAVSQSVVLIRG